MVNNPLYHEMEKVDKTITRMLNTARNKVEGLRRNMQRSKDREKEDLWNYV